jgi:hypothetical protein
MLCQFSAVKGSQMGRFTPIYLFIYLFIRVLLVYILLSSRFCCKMSRYSQLMPICTIMFNERLCLVALSEGLKIERWVPAGVTLLEAGEHPDSFNYWIQRDVSARIWYTTCSPPPQAKPQRAMWNRESHWLLQSQNPLERNLNLATFLEEIKIDEHFSPYFPYFTKKGHMIGVVINPISV